MCKWLGWSYQDLLDCPAEYIPVIIDMINEEAEESRGSNRG